MEGFSGSRLNTTIKRIATKGPANRERYLFVSDDLFDSEVITGYLAYLFLTYFLFNSIKLPLNASSC
jgi:hypothetical protein